MKILWDLRLFSFKYKNRGVGFYTKSLCIDFLQKYNSDDIYILGDTADLPSEIISKTNGIIQYKSNNWKSDLFQIPKIIKKYKIDIIHYWIALGPIHKIGLGLKTPCKTIATIHDLAVEQWNDIPYLDVKRKSWYWKIQKKLIKNIDCLIFNSESTKLHFNKAIKGFKGSSQVVYPKIEYKVKKYSVKKTIVTLGGSETKNLKRTIEAFKKFHDNNPQFTLQIHGNTDELDQSEFHDNSIQFINYNEYHKNLSTSMALLSFSLYEGLGIPPIEAMSLGIPSAVSNIPSFHETLNESAIYADPYNITDIAKAIEEIISKNETYKRKVKANYNTYKNKVINNGDLILNIYRNI